MPPIKPQIVTIEELDEFCSMLESTARKYRDIAKLLRQSGEETVTIRNWLTGKRGAKYLRTAATVAYDDIVESFAAAMQKQAKRSKRKR